MRLRDLFITTVALAATLIAAAGTAHAQRAPCRGETDEGYKVLRTGIVVADALLKQRLENALDSQLFKALQDFDDAKLPRATLLACENSRPGDGDYGRQELEHLNRNNALLEIWGNVVADAGQPAYDARIAYALIPVRFYTPPPGDRAAIQRESYRINQPASHERLRAQFDVNVLKAYMFATLGSKALRDKKYDDAFGRFCGADRLLRQVKSADPSGGRAALTDYVRARAAETLQLAPANSLQLWKTTDKAANPCGRRP
jgi:hypothetical protein